MNTDTPVPPDEPAGQNPPDGAIIDYHIGPATSGPVSLEILDASGKLVRRYSSDDPVEKVNPRLEIPQYWVRLQQRLSGQAGMHRFLWDTHYTPLPESREDYPMQAVFHNTPAARTSPWALPGTYTIKLTAGDHIYTQPLVLKMDPRVKTSPEGLTLQFTVAKQLYDGELAAISALNEIRTERARDKQRNDTTLDQKLAELEGAPADRFAGRFGPPRPDTLSTLRASLGQLMQSIDEADVAPTPQQVAAAETRRASLDKLLQRWAQLKSEIKK
jgi:hypothetical protein